ncbi:MAG: DUF4920 domain-containing protein [Sphingobacteriaceae bacterium]|nr:MAG: DUF4920 domain-containing protein [Sphingobacteriaceae bacterium]
MIGKRISLIALGILLSCSVFAQQPLPHGMVFGTKPDTAGAMDAVRLREYMGTKKRISTVIKGKVVKVITEKGGWFEIEAGKRTLMAHFKDYGVILPKEIAGRIVIIDAVAFRRFTADDSQHFAGDTITYRTDEKLKRRISLEVKGLMVYK